MGGVGYIDAARPIYTANNTLHTTPPFCRKALVARNA